MAPPFYRLFKDTYALARYPLSLGYLAGTIKKETDWDVMVYNADFIPDSEPGIKNSYMTSVGFDKYLCNLRDSSGQVWRETKSVILEYKPDVVGISSMSQNFASSRIVAKLAKEINRDTIVVVGGPHPSMVGGEVLKCRDIDICVKGEGEAAATTSAPGVREEARRAELRTANDAAVCREGEGAIGIDGECGHT